MRAFLLRRLVHAVFVVWGVVTVVFFLVRLTGDPAALLVDDCRDCRFTSVGMKQLAKNYGELELYRLEKA